ncbi:MAG: DUF3891 family protein [Phycisphaerales bacterium JB040]
MLKATVGHEVWLVQQPHHAQVSGYLAAHWGGVNGFARPGAYPGATDPARWRDEVVLGIAEHDNGWWETEAMPRISDRDGLPVGVGEAAAPSDANEFTPWISAGLDRWRLGIGRLERQHPYAALLVSLHAYWLYGVSFADLAHAGEPFRHFVFGGADVAPGLVPDPVATRAFLEEMEETQSVLRARISDEPALAGAIEPEHLSPHVRLLQLLDSMSLYLALNDTGVHELPGVARSSWEDRCTITWRRRDAGTIELDPYPFDVDGLRVSLPARVVEGGTMRPGESPISCLHAAAVRSLDFVFVSAHGPLGQG